MDASSPPIFCTWPSSSPRITRLEIGSRFSHVIVSTPWPHRAGKGEGCPPCGVPLRFRLPEINGIRGRPPCRGKAIRGPRVRRAQPPVADLGCQTGANPPEWCSFPAFLRPPRPFGAHGVKQVLGLGGVPLWSVSPILCHQQGRHDRYHLFVVHSSPRRTRRSSVAHVSRAAHVPSWKGPRAACAV